MSRFCHVGGSVFFQLVSLQGQPRLTKHAPDAGDSAQISSSFLRLSIIPGGRHSAAHPSAGIPYGDDGANRWVVIRLFNMPLHFKHTSID